MILVHATRIHVRMAERVTIGAILITVRVPLDGQETHVVNRKVIFIYILIYNKR